ncbi:LysE family translocator [Pontivivens insulae]|uniref:Homoserine/homoserine lactone efflux protein n=1 Tax=Pontivivens insulae TaxID=1639689 RepID=A0A2R8ADE9_9RHOB|nr:LysE family translocator [Pontivivens insulae]RED14186.1 threonine/homoserine/homoserine lactone efflux protein [Pontivivens insulae]SPF30261.1 Homoserine/homoserine lactone efflux protein [Pontivivens insulae]
MISVGFLVTALIVVLAPGTGVMYTLSVALTRGFRAAIAAVIGCTAGILPHLLAAVFGLAAVLHASALAFQVVKYAGVLFLLWMAYKTWTDRSPLGEAEVSERDAVQIAVRGALINVLNPKLSLFFLAFLPQFVVAEAGNVTAQMLLLGGVFSAMTAAVFLIYAFFASVARRKVLESTRVMTWIRRAFALSFGGLAMRVALDRS